MKYPHIVRYVAGTVWSLHPAKMAEILEVLAFRAAGHEFTADEIQARIGTAGGGESSSRGDVAVIPLRGVIAHRMGTLDESSGGMSAERFAGMVNAAAANPAIATIVLDVDSPGGTVPGVPEAAAAVYAARGVKPVIAVANSMMASAAYWICSQASEIVAIPSIIEGKIGSIGAYMAHQDVSAALDKEGVKVTLVSAGKYKTEGNPFEPLSAEAQAILQAQVDTGYANFVKDVARGRGVTQAAVREGYGEGRAVSAKDALKAGMIDSIATMDETMGRVMGRKSSGGLRAGAESVRLL